ncbi:MAG TPA: hypothetical protein VFD49_08735 [Candidatus Dormibacteraeota bacterium]|nr:hypothetical protein [Candidatus Dormibacteraeota bacterium]
MTSFFVLDPTGRPEGGRATLAPRPRSLAGLTLGLLDNRKHNAGVLLAELGRLLVARHGVGRVVDVQKPHFGLPAPAEIVEPLATECDLVVTAIGD